MKIGSVLKEYRKLKGYTQKEVAELVNVTPSVYARYERDVIDVQLDRVLELSNVLGFSKSIIFDVKDNIEHVLQEDLFEEVNGILYELQNKSMEQIEESKEDIYLLLQKAHKTLEENKKYVRELVEEKSFEKFLEENDLKKFNF